MPSIATIFCAPELLDEIDLRMGYIQPPATKDVILSEMGGVKLQRIHTLFVNMGIADAAMLERAM